MSNPNNSGDLDGLRKLLDRLAAVDPQCMPAVIAGQWCMLETIPGQWAKADPEARRTIEEEIDRLPRRKKSD